MVRCWRRAVLSGGCCAPILVVHSMTAALSAAVLVSRFICVRSPGRAFHRRGLRRRSPTRGAPARIRPEAWVVRGAELFLVPSEGTIVGAGQAPTRTTPGGLAAHSAPASRPPAIHTCKE